MSVLGNALGNSIVDKSTPRASTPATKKQSGSGFDWESSEAVGANNFYGADVSGFGKELDFNPNIDYTPGSVSGDTQRAIAAVQEEGVTLPSMHLENMQIGADSPELEEVVVSARRWNGVDDRNLAHLTTPFLFGGGGMVDDHGEEIARRAMQMTDMGFDSLRQRQNLAILNDAFNPLMQAKNGVVGIYNTGVKALAGAASLFDLPNGLDHTVGMQNSIRDALSINLDSPLANAIAPNFANLSPAARVGFELVGDGLALAPALAGLRSVTADMSSVNRALQMPLTLDLQPGAMYSGIPVKPRSLFAADNSIHKNSLEYVGDTHVYRIIGPDGATYKIGESAQGVRTADSASIRAEQQVRALQRATGDVYKSEVIGNYSAKAPARQYETSLIERFRRIYGDAALPGNKTNR